MGAIRMKIHSMIGLAVLAALGCGEDAADAGANPAGAAPAACASGEYVPFDAANYDNQRLRLGAYVQMVAGMKGAAVATPFDAATARSAFEEARRLYEETAALREKVRGRGDDHLDGAPAVGVELDRRIVKWLLAGAAADTGLEATVAAQWVDKSLIEFFFLSVHHEMVAGARSNWDEAFGYLGAPEDNDEGGRVGLAGVASKRDAAGGTSLAQAVFAGIVDGRCALGRALTASGSESIDPGADADVSAAIAFVDGALRETLAYSVGHEAFEMAELKAALANAPDDPALHAEMWIKLAELDPYFRPLERLMVAAGGASKTRAEAIRVTLDAAWAGWSDRETAWMADFDAAGVIERVEAELGIDVRG